MHLFEGFCELDFKRKEVRYQSWDGKKTKQQYKNQCVLKTGH